MLLRATLGAIALPALLSGTDPGASPADSAPPEPCRVTGVMESADDVALALSACEIARARFAELFGGPVPPVRIQLTRSAGYRIGTDDEGAAVLWPTSATMEASMGRGHVSLQWREVLPHEMAHALLTARFFAETEIPDSEYGTPLPDWLDEGIAIWAEPPESRAERIAQARALPLGRQSLAAILGSPHPAMANDAAWRMREGAAPPTDDEALWAFYPQSIGVLAFVMESGGPEALGALMERLLSAVVPPGVDLLSGLPGMPQDAAGVLEAWDAWLGGPGVPPQ